MNTEDTNTLVRSTQELGLGYLEKFLPAQHKPRNEREELIDKFLARLNPSRKEKGLKPITYPRLSAMFRSVPTSDLYPFYNDCDNAKNFSSLFWWKFRKQ